MDYSVQDSKHEVVRVPVREAILTSYAQSSYKRRAQLGLLVCLFQSLLFVH